MARYELKDVESESGKKYKVEWDLESHELFIDGELIGEAIYLGEAILMAKAWVYDK